MKHLAHHCFSQRLSASLRFSQNSAVFFATAVKCNQALVLEEKTHLKGLGRDTFNKIEKQ